MTQRKILVDSNAYFRLAKEIHPLLAKPFGSEKYCLYIIEGFEAEYLKNSRLKSVFSWVGEAKYKDNRKRKVALSKADKAKVLQSFDFLMSTAIDMGLTTGRTDVEAVTIAYVLGISIVTDDADMIKLAKEFEVSAIKAIELLKMLENAAVIDRQKVRAVVGYWHYLRDPPRDCDSDYQRIFSEEPPASDADES